ncbi:MAG: 6-phospho-beta-glucosidase [Candidatus Bathyarchaeota archaeon]
MKVAVIGGGSSYTPEIINGFLGKIETFPVKELWLMDISRERLDIVGKFAQRMVKEKGSPFKVHLSSDRRKAIEDAQYIITQLRVGGMAARREDEYLGRRHGLIGQETTGVGGMAKALRTIPVILSIAQDIKEVSSDALLVNFTNPAGLNTEALARFAPEVQTVGVCNVPITTKIRILKNIGYNISHEHAQLNTLGLNHLSWHRGMTVDGEDVWPQVLEKYIEGHFEDPPHVIFPAEMIRSLRVLPNSYLQYYYFTEKKLKEQEKWPPSRAEQVIEIEANLLRQYSEPYRTEPPDDLMKRGGAHYSTVATQLLDAHYNDLDETQILNVPHNGSISGYPGDWVLEMPCKVNRNGVKPIKADPLPSACYGLLASVKNYELLTVKAAVYGDRDVAYQALLAHPLGPSADKVEAVLQDLLKTNRGYLPQFKD